MLFIYRFTPQEKEKIKQYINESYRYLKYNEDKVILDGILYNSKQLGKIYNKLIQIRAIFIDFLEDNSLKPKTDREKASILMVTQLHPEYRCKVKLDTISDYYKLKGYKISVKKMIF